MRSLAHSGSHQTTARGGFLFGGFMVERKPVSKKMRFEVFKRDGFKCRYCGSSSPEVVLHVDHIHPVKEGGKNTLLNLVTSCESCNLGKGATLLSDNSVAKLESLQIKELTEKKEQFNMYLKWKKELINFENKQIESIEEIFKSTGMTFTDQGKKNALSIINKEGFQQFYSAVEKCFANLGEYNIAYVKGIINNTKSENEFPELKQLFYLRGILRNRGLSYFDNEKCISILISAFKRGESIEDLTEASKTARNWSQFRRMVGDYNEC